MIYKEILVGKASAYCKTIASKDKTALNTTEKQAAKMYDEMSYTSLPYGDVVKSFYAQGYGVEKAKLHIREWFDLDLAFRIQCGGKYENNDLVVFSGDL